MKFIFYVAWLAGFMGFVYVFGAQQLSERSCVRQSLALSRITPLFKNLRLVDFSPNGQFVSFRMQDFSWNVYATNDLSAPVISGATDGQTINWVFWGKELMALQLSDRSLVVRNTSNLNLDIARLYSADGQYIRSAMLSPDDRMIALLLEGTNSQGQKIYWWVLRAVNDIQHDLLARVDGYNISWIGFSPDSRFVAFRLSDSTRSLVLRRVTNIANDLVNFTKVDDQNVTVFDFSPDSKRVLMSLGDGSCVFRQVTNLSTDEGRIFPSGGKNINWIWFSPDGEWIALYLSDDSCVLRHISNLDIDAVSDINGQKISFIKFNMQSTLIALCSKTGPCVLRQTSNPLSDMMRIDQIENQNIARVDFNGQLIAFGLADNRTTVLCSLTDQIVKKIKSKL